MKLSADLFPYPVLKSDLEDYINNDGFKVTITANKESTGMLSLKAVFTLTDEGLLKLVKEKKAIFALHIEGIASSYRKIWYDDDSDNIIYEIIAVEDIRSKFEVNALLIANKEITNYYNTNFNPKFYGSEYSIRKLNKGDILAFVDTQIIDIDLEYIEKVSAESMIKVAPTNNKFMTIDLDDDVIHLYLPQETYGIYKQRSFSEKERDLLILVFILPVLTAALERLKRNECDESLSWVFSLRRLIEKEGFSLSDSEEAIVTAQRVLNLPLERTLKVFFEEGDELID